MIFTFFCLLEADDPLFFDGFDIEAGTEDEACLEAELMVDDNQKKHLCKIGD